MIPAFNSEWRHTGSGKLYRVTGLANMQATKPEFPKTVIYTDDDGFVWSRDLDSFLVKFEPVEKLIGKTIVSVDRGVEEKVRLNFTDGTYVDFVGKPYLQEFTSKNMS